MRILTFNGVYKPGYKGGGPIKSISNMAESLRAKLEFFIVCADRDYNENAPYKNIKTKKWTNVDNEKVYYHKGTKINLLELKKVIDNVKPDIIYLNGLFSLYTRKCLLLKQLKLISSSKIIICPRGDLNEGDSNSLLKKIKKTSYIKLIKMAKLTNGLKWHATSENEFKAIKSYFATNDIVLASNIPSPIKNNELHLKNKTAGNVKLIYVSRINKKKNLKKSLELLKDISGKISVDIYGPVFDEDYWEECQKVISSLPNNIQVNYKGILEMEEVKEKLKDAHFMYMITKGENYGHIIYESFSVGTPCIISDQTPWLNLFKSNAGWDLKLKNESEIQNILERCVNMAEEEYLSMQKGAFEYAKLRFEQDQSMKATYNMFKRSESKF